MKKILIYEYLMRIDKDDIYDFGLSHGIKINNHDINILFYYIKKEYLRILKNPMDVINEIKDKVNSDVYDKILNLYLENKDKII